MSNLRQQVRQLEAEVYQWQAWWHAYSHWNHTFDRDYDDEDGRLDRDGTFDGEGKLDKDGKLGKDHTIGEDGNRDKELCTIDEDGTFDLDGGLDKDGAVDEDGSFGDDGALDQDGNFDKDGELEKDDCFDEDGKLDKDSRLDKDGDTDEDDTFGRHGAFDKDSTPRRVRERSIDGETGARSEDDLRFFIPTLNRCICYEGWRVERDSVGGVLKDLGFHVSPERLEEALGDLEAVFPHRADLAELAQTPGVISPADGAAIRRARRAPETRHWFHHGTELIPAWWSHTARR